MRTLNRQAAVVGVGTTPVGRVPESSALELTLDAMYLALDDAGLTWEDVDGLCAAVSRVDPFNTGAAVLSEHLGIRPAFSMAMPVGGMQFVSAIYQSAAMVATGVATAVVLVSADNLLSGYGRSGAVDHYADTGHPEFESPFGTHIPSLYALIAQRHMHDYGTTSQDLAAVAVQMRDNASRHPMAQMKDAITVDDVLASKPIASPFHLLDCSLISDGGVAFVVVAPERAEELGRPPVWILGAGESRAHQHVTQSPSLSHFSARESSSRAFEMAGLGPEDIDLALLYDPFTIAPILSLEALGFCPEGGGGRFVSEGNIAPDGRIPVNPHGGLLSYAHPGRPGGVLHAAEAVLQLRGEARGVQVADAGTAVVQANAGITSGEVTLILGR